MENIFQCTKLKHGFIFAEYPLPVEAIFMYENILYILRLIEYLIFTNLVIIILICLIKGEFDKRIQFFTTTFS